jgi:hypothetical protein
VVTCWFLVIQSCDQWWVDCEGKSYGPFDSIEQATSNAIRFAEIFGDAGRRSQVFAPDDTGRLVMAWQAPKL